ncbi:E3 ubiquitin-protein ligase RNF26 [Engraulis encrasicolus]|uniref:E3 ubiquitin-protein ligase RNF26 n=1 Tax=Engraulis encrasicolus TaxID=184585 RepID=UPI002FCF1E71
MGLVNVIFYTLGKCFEIVSFLLDLNFVIVHSLIRFLVASINFVHQLPMLVTNSVLECWNLSLVCLFTMSEGVSILTHNVAGGGQQLVGGVVECCKMVGYLASHVLLRTRDLLHRGLLSGHSVLKHVWEGFGIALSLILYLANTIVNLLLIGTQNMYTVFVGLCETALYPIQNIVELALTALSFLYSSLVGASIFLWTPCLLAAEFVASLCQVFFSIFLLNVYGLLFTLSVVAGATVYLNPEVSRRHFRRLAHYVNTVPSLRGLRGALRRLYVLERNLRQRLVLWDSSHIRLAARRLQRRVVVVAAAVRADGDGNVDAGTGDALPPVPPPPERREHDRDNAAGGGGGGGGAGDGQPAQDLARRPLAAASEPELGHHSSGVCQHKGAPDGSGDSCKASSSSSTPGVDSSLLSLLQEQEERKKCVICQDSFKTVVLLPCRHLCLCRDCTDILLTQPVYQRNCPLCRHMIFQTMDVYL